MADPFLSLTVDGLDDMVRGINDAQRALSREQAKQNQKIAGPIAAAARAKAAGGTPQQRHFAIVIRAKSTARQVRIAISQARGTQAGGWGTFFGAKKWKQFPTWVGNSWDAGKRGEGPYVINDTIADHLDEIEDKTAKAFETALFKAFPGGMERGRF